MRNNISFSDAVGTTRGIHAEPWVKWVSIATGRIFCAWVDLALRTHFRRGIHGGTRSVASSGWDEDAEEV